MELGHGETTSSSDSSLPSDIKSLLLYRKMNSILDSIGNEAFLFKDFIPTIIEENQYQVWKSESGELLLNTFFYKKTF